MKAWHVALIAAAGIFSAVAVRYIFDDRPRIGVVLHSYPTANQARSDAQSTIPPRASVQAPYSSVPATAAPVSLRKAGPVTSTRLSDFLHSKNLGSYLKAALENPTPDTLRYAALAQNECSNGWDATLVAADQEAVSDPRRTAVLKMRAERCAGFDISLIPKIRAMLEANPALRDSLTLGEGSQFYANLLRLRPEQVDAALGGDALHNLPTTLVSAQDAATVALAAGDLAQRTSVLKIDGRSLSPTEESSIGVALLMVACDFGAPCDRSGPLLQKACGLYGYCDYDSVEDLFRSVGSFDHISLFTCCDSTHFSFATAMDLRTRISQAIRAGDPSVLSAGP